MKGTKTGILTLLIFLFAVPLFVDFVLLFFAGKNIRSLGMSSHLTSGYLGMLPFYVLYLAVAFTIIYILKTRSKKQTDQE